MTPYSTVLLEFCTSSVRRMNLFHSLSLFREHKSQARDLILKAFAEKNLQLLGYRGLIIELHGRELCPCSRRQLLFRRRTQGHWEEILDNAGIQLEYVVSKRRTVPIKTLQRYMTFERGRKVRSLDSQHIDRPRRSNSEIAFQEHDRE